MSLTFLPGLCGCFRETYISMNGDQATKITILSENNTVAANYTYDAWGKLLSITDANGNTITSGIGVINPIRYRGYYYDTETGFYYVSSRYYDPEVGRFISPDTTDVLTATPDQLTDKNLYAYCDNNPVMRVDKDGRFWNFIIGAVGGALIGGGVQIISNLVSGKNWSDGLGVAMATGVASGLLAASGVGLIGSIAGNAAISMAGNATNQVVKNNGFNNFDVGDMVIDGIIGGVAGAAGGSGMGKSANISTLNRNLTKKVFSGSTQVARQGAKYYLSQTKYLYKEFLVKPMLKAGAASAISFVVKDVLW